MNIIVDENIPLLKDALRDSTNVKTASGRSINKDMLLAEKCNALIVRSITKINSELLDGANVEFIGTSTSGIDHVDEQYLKDKEIAFASAPGANANSVAEYVVYSIIMWAKSSNIDLQGRKIGIVGYGNVGSIVASYAKLLGLDVYVNDPPLLEEGFNFPVEYSYSSIEDICTDCDIITNHVPLTKGFKHPTFRLFAKELIDLLKSDTLFIHTSRGFVVDEQSLLGRLEKRDITAVIDVWENEPVINPSLVKFCFMATPHIAGYSYDGKLKGALMMAGALEKYFDIKTNKKILVNELNSGVKKISVNTDTALLLEMLAQNRRLRDDYIAFLQTMLVDDKKQRAAEFDRLRKEYPLRRECLVL